LKYGKCQVSGASTTPSSDMKRPATIFLILISSGVFGPSAVRSTLSPTG
jgi:hypothetical protein